ncbi:MAG: hypothetical protein BMS9Abin34_384 [Patescibacteria group bacterium]|nr:MAG: hypothetical protein BMS9Abin34_384 [Patescibacteria group bacterium]
MEFLRSEDIESNQRSETRDQRSGIRDQKSVAAGDKNGSKIRRLLRFPVKTRRRRVGLLVLLTLLSLLFLLIVVIPAAVLYPRALVLKSKTSSLQAALNSKDLGAVEASLTDFNAAFNSLEDGYYLLSYLSRFPFVDQYYSDGVRLLTSGSLGIESAETVVAAIKPHAEVLGFKNNAGSVGGQTTVEQQLANILSTLPKVADELDQVWENLLVIQKELGQVDPQRYPKEIRGVKVRFWLEEAQKILTEAEPLIEQGRSILELAPQFLGVQNERTYLVIFQNDAEIRATGGFMTALSLLAVSGGKIVSNDVYPGVYPHAFQPYYQPPNPLGKYLGVSSWLFHDVNYYPDFPTSAKKILEVWNAARLPKVSGVLVVNTDTAGSLLEITGPLEMPPYNLDLAGYDLPDSCKAGGRDFTSENLVCRLEFYVEKNPVGSSGAETKKDLLGRLSEAIIQKITSSSAETWPRLIDLFFDFLARKDLMAYMTKSVEQDLVKELGYAGEIKAFEGDYLHVNDNNFGGRKTDMFMTQEVDQTLKKLENGTWRKTVSIKYYNPQKYDNWLSAVYRDFVRIYVPKGSKLVSVNGANEIWDRPDRSSKKVQNPAGWTEFGKTVFGAFFNIDPQKERTLTFVYDLPPALAKAMEETKSYRLLVQKQSGTNIGLVQVKIGDKMKSFDLETDKEITLSIGE